MKVTEWLASKQSCLIGDGLCLCSTYRHLEFSGYACINSRKKSEEHELQFSVHKYIHSVAQDSQIGSVAGLHAKNEHLALVLQQYAKSKAISGGQSVHAEIIMLGCDSVTFLANCLIEMYGNCGRAQEAQAVLQNIPLPNVYTFNIILRAYAQNQMLDQARKVFQEMPFRDNVSWNAMITALTEAGQNEEALEVYCQMLTGSVIPDKVTFICVLNICADLVFSKLGIESHAAIIVYRLDADVVVGTAIINMYGKCGRVLSAKNVFDRLPAHDIICWNAILSVHSQNGKSEETLVLFKRMQFEGMRPNNISYVCAVDACASLGVLEEGKRVHTTMITCEAVRDLTVGNTLLNMYGKCGSVYYAGLIFSQMPSKDIVSWNAMATALLQNEQNGKALRLYYDMQVKGLKLNDITFMCALNACSALQDLEEGLKIHHHIFVELNAPDTMVENALINMYGKCCSISNAKHVFSIMTLQDLVSWNGMINLHVFNRNSEYALECFDLMLREGMFPDEVTFIAILDACTRLKDLKKGQQYHACLTYLGYHQNACIETALVSMYGKCEAVWRARNAFASSLSQSLPTWNAFMGALTENGYGREALHLFQTMQRHAMMPDEVSVACAADACGILAAVEDGMEIHHVLTDCKYERDVVVRTALINMYGKCGSPVDAKAVFDGVQQWDPVLCNATISAFAQSGHAVEAFHVCSQMETNGIKPDQITLVCILTACSHSGDIDTARHIFVFMSKDYNLSQVEDHYVCMVDGLGRAGLLDEAEGLISNTVFGMCALVWSTLLGACQVHNDIDRGRRAVSKCTKIDPDDSAAYVAMSNIHVAAG